MNQKRVFLDHVFRMPLCKPQCCNDVHNIQMEECFIHTVVHTRAHLCTHVYMECTRKTLKLTHKNSVDLAVIFTHRSKLITH